MRMRNKPWAKPELEACPWFVGEPEKEKGRWRSRFVNAVPLYLELGCGKGGFIAAAATADPGSNFIAADLEFKMLGVARRKCAAAYEAKGIGVQNLLLTRMNIEGISQCFDSTDSIDGIYINFCNPWPRKKHNKHRLTHPRQLMQYREFLRDGGLVRFKTDDDELFEDSLEYFRQCGFSLEHVSYDLHAENRADNIMTEHEKMFSEEGIRIKFLIAKKLSEAELMAANENDEK